MTQTEIRTLEALLIKYGMELHDAEVKSTRDCDLEKLEKASEIKAHIHELLEALDKEV